MYRRNNPNDSSANLQVHYNTKPTNRVYPYQATSTEAVKMQERKKLADDYHQDYRAADYKKAVEYWNENSYKEKRVSGQYRQLDMFGDTAELKKFGIGIYLYVQLLRRLNWIFFLLALIAGVPMALNIMGNGLNKYSLSYGTYLIKVSLGNYSTSVTGYDAYIITGAHCLLNLVFFLFFLFWKTHNHTETELFETDQQIIHPKKFTVEMCGFPKKGVTNEELEQFFSNFGPVYECSLVYDYRDQLKYFQEIDELDEQIKEVELEIKLGGGDRSDLEELKKKKNEAVQHINSIKISPHIISAYVHFQYMKGKQDLLTYYSNHYMFDSCSHACCKTVCCCCMEAPAQRYLFRGLQLKIRHTRVNDPEELNWQALDVGTCSRILRILVAIVIILVFIAVCSTLVSLCSIFISINSTNCDSVTIPATIAAAQSTTDATQKNCFCNSNLFTLDSDIQNLCQEIFKKLYVENGLQIAAAVISTITNALFSIIIRKVVDFTKPKSFSSSLVTKTLVLFLFLFINTCVLPLLIYADVLGFKISSYVSLIQLLIPSVSTWFDMTNFSYYSDFSNIWYRNVSPYFVNFIVLNTILMWVNFAVTCCRNRRRISNLEDEQGKILQKHMNKQIIDYEVDVVKETADMFLVVFMSFMYSAGLPAMVALGALNMFSRYITNKHLILNYSKRIEGLTEDFSELSIGILPWALILSCFFGIWMLTATNYVYPDVINVKIPGMDQYAYLSTFFPRVFYLSYTLLMALLVIVYYFFYNLIVRFFSWLGSLCYESNQIVSPPRKSFSEATKTMNILHSYNIHSNPKYKNIIINLERYLQDEQ